MAKDLGGEAEEYCSVADTENTVHLILPSGPFSSGPRSPEQESPLQIELCMFAGISTHHTPSGLWHPCMANNGICLFDLFLYSAPRLNRDSQCSISCIASSHGAVHVSVASYCLDFRRLPPTAHLHL